MKVKKETYERNSAYNKTTYEQIIVRTRKEFMFKDLIQKGAKKMNISMSDYVNRAIEQKLIEDGILDAKIYELYKKGMSKK